MDRARKVAARKVAPAFSPGASSSSASASSSSAALRPPASASSQSACVGSGSGSAGTAAASRSWVVPYDLVSGSAVTDSGAARESPLSGSPFREGSTPPSHSSVGSPLFVPEKGNAAPGLLGWHAASLAVGASPSSSHGMSQHGRGGARGCGGGRGRCCGNSAALPAPLPPP
jgi:hypothetical protein